MSVEWSFRQLRVQANLSVAALAREAGVPVGVLSDLERGKGRAAGTVLASLAEVYGVPVEHLLALCPLPAGLQEFLSRPVGTPVRGAGGGRTTLTEPKAQRQNAERERSQEETLRGRQVRVLVIDSDQASAELMTRGLLGAGYDATVTGSVMHGLVLAREPRPALVVTELSLPDGTGADVVTRLSAVGIPVMVVTGTGDVETMVSLLGMGAADYLIKPFDVREFLARVAVQARDRRIEANREVLVVGELTLDVDQRLVLFAGRDVCLTPKEREVLAVLMREPGRIFSGSELLDRVWGVQPSVTSNLVAVTMSSIRRKLHAVEAYQSLRTVRGFGYVMRGGGFPDAAWLSGRCAGV